MTNNLEEDHRPDCVGVGLSLFMRQLLVAASDTTCESAGVTACMCKAFHSSHRVGPGGPGIIIVTSCETKGLLKSCNSLSRSPKKGSISIYYIIANP